MPYGKKRSAVPLIRPLIPRLSEISTHLKKSEKAGIYSNFGPNFQTATELLNKKISRNVLPVTNGTVAIQIACQTILPKGSRVVIPDYTHIGTYVGVRDAGMTPLISAASRWTWTLSLMVLESLVDEFDAFVVVAPFGYYVAIEPYEAFAKKHGKKIIYDFAGAWGQFPKTEFPVTYSLHATKGWSCGEGGLISFGAYDEYARARRLTNFNVNPDYSFDCDMGGNFKLDEIRCAMIVAQLKNYSRIKQKMHEREKAMFVYEGFFGAVPYCSSATLAVFPGMENVNPDKLKNKFVCKFYYPLLSQMKHLRHVPKLSGSYDFFKGCLALPIDVTEKEQKMVIGEISSALRR